MMYKIDNILSTYEGAVKDIQQINEAIKELSEEANKRDFIKIIKNKKYDDVNFTVLINKDGNNIRIDIDYQWLIEKIRNFSAYFPNKPKDVDTKDKIICIIESRVREAVYNVAKTIK